MGTQTTTQTVETMSVPADMLALRTVDQQPLCVTVPGNAPITVTGHTNARYFQKVTVEDIANKTTYVFTGSGEDETAMEVQGSKEKGVVLLHALESKPLYRTLTVLCEYSSQGPSGRLEKSAVLVPRVLYEYNGPRHLKRMSWEIFTEDGVDNDYNDSVIRIVADVNQDLS
ncbi:hypothetical protein J3458_013445 [Metarhizium acridum]|uniref:uncharacterized protein n=1 Tax=Metarhizium acridum TaxID=92637 RepID=UPI001C6C17BA|nr:hypothetical protein J3458_013445 [Metarhizium acridum]